MFLNPFGNSPGKAPSYVVAGFLSLALIQEIFLGAAFSQSRLTLESVQSLLKKESSATNPYLLSQSLNDLEALGVLRCVVITDARAPEKPFFDSRFKGSCGRSLLGLSAFSVRAEVRSVNGMVWHVHFEALSGSLFQWLLWFSRAFALLLGLLLVHWHYRRLEFERELQSLEKSYLLKFSETASQVSHDIRSPLAALMAVAQQARGLDDGSRQQLQVVAGRIRDIANDLLKRGSPVNLGGIPHSQAAFLPPEAQPAEEKRVQDLSALVEEVCLQKAAQYSDWIGATFDHEAEYGIFSEVPPTELTRVLSNLIDNGVEALVGSGTIRVRVQQGPGLPDGRKSSQILITDTGKGISPELLPHLGQRGGTYGKPGGNGLGLHYAQGAIMAWGGTIQLTSRLQEGTHVSVLLPRAEAPLWFVPEVDLQDIGEIVVVDDDPAIHALWRRRLQVFKGEWTFHTSPEEFLRGFRARISSPDPHGRILHLLDWEFRGHNLNGLDLIGMCGIVGSSLLVTGHSEDASIQEKCLKLGVGLLSKSAIAKVPVKI